VLRHLGVGDRVDWFPFRHLFLAAFPGFRMRVPAGLEPFIEAYAHAFLPHAKEIDTFVRLCVQMHVDIHRLGMNVSVKDIDSAAARFPTLFRYRSTTLAEVLQEHVPDAQARAALSAYWPHSGLPPSSLGFFPFAQMLANDLEGCYQPRGGMQSVVDALVAAFERDGGELVLGNGTRRILTEDRRVTGVTLDGGNDVRARMVVSNADALHTFEELVGADKLPPAFRQRVRRMQPSLSAFLVMAATGRDLAGIEDIAHTVFPCESWDHEESHRAILDGQPGGVWLSIPTLHDTSHAPPGEHVIVMTSLARHDAAPSWEQKREAFAAEMVRRADNALPGIAGQLSYADHATPETLRRYSRNQGGACYGWANSPAQTPRRLPHETPLDGLLLAGHWTQPGSASLRVLASGIHTAFIAQRRLLPDQPLPAFEEAALPSLS
jgi:prolycopene isomerase